MIVQKKQDLKNLKTERKKYIKIQFRSHLKCYDFQTQQIRFKM